MAKSYGNALASAVVGPTPGWDQINCQSTPARRAMVKSACDTVLGSLKKA